MSLVRELLARNGMGTFPEGETQAEATEEGNEIDNG